MIKINLICGLAMMMQSAIQSAQPAGNIRGVVTDGASGQALPYVSVVVLQSNPAKGTVTDEEGRFNLNGLAVGRYDIQSSFVGYETFISREILVSSGKEVFLEIVMRENVHELGEVVITSQQADANISAPQTGVEKMEIKTMNKIPVLLGERDILKTIQLTPGVKGAGEGSAGYYVRGGSADQNLILLDDVSLYNASHLMGFFSTFNSDVLSDVTLYKGAMPAQYGERLSSILDVRQRYGDVNDFHLSGSLGLISSKLNIEAPLQKGKSSFLLGARRTYADDLAHLFDVKEARGNYLNFYDVNMKVKFQLSEKNYLSFSGYTGKDKMTLKDVATTDWGNMFGILKWNSYLNNRWTSRTSVFYSRFDYAFAIDVGMFMGGDVQGKSKINDYGLKQDFTYQHNENSVWKTGFSSTYHDLAPGDYDFEKQNSVNLHHRLSSENSLYISNQFKASDRIEIVCGLRLSAYLALGKGEYYTLDENNNVTGAVWYGSGETVKTYLNPEPRISAVFRINEASSVKGGYGRTTQNMHLLTFMAQGTPYDRWISSSNNVKPQIADQFTLGYFHNFANNTVELSVETYHKNMKNQIDYRDNANIEGYNNIDTELLYGKGRAYGIEMMIRKARGKLTGWIGYTLAKSERKIDGINGNRWYNAYQDRTHDVSVVAMYDISHKWSLSAAWVYCTGNAITFPSGKYVIDGKDVMYYAERNGYRMPSYHRLDVGATCLLKKTAKFESELVFSLYNAYGRENAYSIRFQTDRNDAEKTTAYQHSLFTYVPSISWNFKF
jgi:hypothetical protein